MKNNNKGISIIELIISISLISVVMLFLYNLLSNVTFEKDDDYFASLNQANRIEMIRIIEDTLLCFPVTNYELLDNNKKIRLYAVPEVYYEIIVDNSNKKITYKLNVNEEDYGSAKWTIKNATAGKITCNDVGDGIITTKYIQCTIPIYTSNINNNENNNNTIDDITFTFKKEIYKISNDFDDERLTLYKTIEKKYYEGNTFVKLYDGEGADTYANPVYYYNGAVEDNNVLFGGFCWKIVRTTDTGGVKLVYNGVQKDGSCNNTGTDSQIGTSAFNSIWNSPAGVGYMYNTVYTYSSKSSLELSNIVFGNSFTYSGGTYTLTDTMKVSSWSSDYKKIKNKHYTCFTTGTTCSSLYYVYFTESDYAYYITLTGGKSVGDALNEMLFADDVNKTNSIMKTYIENWYENNMTSYTSYLEDTIFCNDRSILNLKGWNPNGEIEPDIGPSLLFKNSNTNYSLVCGSVTDQFRVGNTKAPLKYPVGLLTAPEVWFASKDISDSISYLNTGQYYLLGSPNYFSNGSSSVRRSFLVSVSSPVAGVSNPYGVRPSVSLKSDTYYTSGDGSYTNPYLIE